MNKLWIRTEAGRIFCTDMIYKIKDDVASYAIVAQYMGLAPIILKHSLTAEQADEFLDAIWGKIIGSTVFSETFKNSDHNVSQTEEYNQMYFYVKGD